MTRRLDKLLKEIDKEKERKERAPSFWQQVFRYSFLGLAIVLPLFGSAYLGHYLGKKYGLPPLVVLLFILLGPVLSLVNLLYLYRRKR